MPQLPRWFGLVLFTFAFSVSSYARADWFNPDEFLPALRSDLRTADKRPVAVRTLEDLPLYDLELDVPGDAATVSVTETVYFTQREAEPLDGLTFQIHANVDPDPARKRVTVPIQVQEVECLEQDCQVQSPHPAVLLVRFSKPLAQNERLRVRLSFSVELEVVDPAKTTMLGQMLDSVRAMRGGSQSGGHGLLARHEKLASLANFFPVLAKRVQGRWVFVTSDKMGDVVSDDLAHVRARISCDRASRIVSNGAVVEEKTTGKDANAKRHVRIVAPLVRDFAVVISPDLVQTKRQLRGVTVSSYYRPSNAKAGKQTLDIAARALTTFEKRFGRYPYSRFALVEVPLAGGAGGVEFSGLVYIGAMLYDENATKISTKDLFSLLSQVMPKGKSRMFSQIGPLLDMLGGSFPGGALGGSSKRGGLSALGGSSALGGLASKLSAHINSMREFVVAHEVAHQWWYVLVGGDSRKSPFADESLTQYSTLLYFEDRYGRKRAEAEADKHLKAGYQMMRLLGEADGPANLPASTYSATAYGGLVYGKAPFVYSKIRTHVGDARFFKALRSYVEQYRFSNAAPTALFDAFKQDTDADAVSALERRWLTEAHGDEDLGKFDLRSALKGML